MRLAAQVIEFREAFSIFDIDQEGASLDFDEVGRRPQFRLNPNPNPKSNPDYEVEAGCLRLGLPRVETEALLDYCSELQGLEGERPEGVSSLSSSHNLES